MWISEELENQHSEHTIAVKSKKNNHSRDGSRAAATSKMECFVIIANGWKLLTVITKHSILDVAAALNPPLHRMKMIGDIPTEISSRDRINDVNHRGVPEGKDLYQIFVKIDYEKQCKKDLTF